MISAVVIFQFRSFDSQLLLRNLAYEIALTIREAQALGIGVRGVGGDFSTAYGAHFEPGTGYLLFRDDNENQEYNEEDDTMLSSYTIGRRNEIVDLCVGSTCDRASLDVMFLRPDPDAIFNPSGTEAQVIVGSPSGNTRIVRITSTGQIAVE